MSHTHHEHTHAHGHNHVHEHIPQVNHANERKIRLSFFFIFLIAFFDNHNCMIDQIFLSSALLPQLYSCDTQIAIIISSYTIT